MFDIENLDVYIGYFSINVRDFSVRIVNWILLGFSSMFGACDGNVFI
jgi:hypothetical protein